MSEAQASVPVQIEQFDPHDYTIIIKRVVVDGEAVFHGKVVELPDLEAFEPTHEEAYSFLVDAIQTSKAAFDEQGREFPAPLPEEPSEYSGRVTLRMPGWLHAQLDYSAKAHQTSLNQYIGTLLSWAVVAAPRSAWQTQVIGAGQVMSARVTLGSVLTGAAGGTVVGQLQEIPRVQFNPAGVQPQGSVIYVTDLAYIPEGAGAWRSDVQAAAAQRAATSPALARAARRALK